MEQEITKMPHQSFPSKSLQSLFIQNVFQRNSSRVSLQYFPPSTRERALPFIEWEERRGAPRVCATSPWRLCLRVGVIKEIWQPPLKSGAPHLQEAGHHSSVVPPLHLEVDHNSYMISPWGVAPKRRRHTLLSWKLHPTPSKIGWQVSSFLQLTFRELRIFFSWLKTCSHMFPKIGMCWFWVNYLIK